MIQEFTQEIKNMVLDRLRDVHTILPGKIVAFDPDRCEASILPYGKYKKPDGSMIDFPQLNEVPVYIMQGSGQAATVVYPVKPDDECIVLFSEQTLETWRTKAESHTDLRFDLSNATAIIGMFAKPNPLMIQAVEQDALIIDRNGTRITLLPNNSITIAGNLTIQGNLNVSGTGNIGGVVVNTHTHTSTQPGTNTSGPN